MDQPGPHQERTWDVDKGIAQLKVLHNLEPEQEMMLQGLSNAYQGSGQLVDKAIRILLNYDEAGEFPLFRHNSDSYPTGKASKKIRDFPLLFSKYLIIVLRETSFL